MADNTLSTESRPICKGRSVRGIEAYAQVRESLKADVKGYELNDTDGQVGGARDTNSKSRQISRERK